MTLLLKDQTCSLQYFKFIVVRKREFSIIKISTTSHKAQSIE